MNSKGILAFALVLMFSSSGCLDSLDDSLSGGFWGDDCSVESSDCPSNPAPDFDLVNQNGEVVNLTQFEGKIVVMTFIYTHCPDVCPAITYQMKKLAEELGDDYEESVVFLSVTVDPARDTPERLASFASAYNASWSFLTIDPELPETNMHSMWLNYKVQVLIDEDACSGEGHYMEGYEGCHCNPGFMQDPWNVDTCIPDPKYDYLNQTIENGSIEADLIQLLNVWNAAKANGLMTENEAMTLLDTYLSQVFASSWTLENLEGAETESKQFYKSNLTLLEFFHTNCGYCNAQVPVLDEFHSNFSSDVNIVSVGGYSLGGNKDNASTIQEFVSDHNSSWTYLHDQEGYLMSSFGLNGYPSWVLVEGDFDAGQAQIVDISTGFKSYNDLVEMTTNYSSYNVSLQIEDILESMYHWRQGHMSDKEMLEMIASGLNYEFQEDETTDYYGVSHSSRLYIIDQNGDFRVLWRGTEWTYASIYHDVQLLL